jgi:hypothetical protein
MEQHTERRHEHRTSNEGHSRCCILGSARIDYSSATWAGATAAERCAWGSYLALQSLVIFKTWSIRIVRSILVIGLILMELQKCGVEL